MNMDVKKEWSDKEQTEVCKASESTYEEFAKELIENVQEIADASDFDAVIIPRLAEDIPPEALVTNKLDGNEIANRLENNLNNFISEGYPVPSPNGGIFASHASVSYNGDDDTGTMMFSVSYTL